MGRSHDIMRKGRKGVERTLRARSTGRRNLRLSSGAQRRPTRGLS
ncbi:MULTISPECIES: hypothetical protein [unclassified Treponema]|nr:MULTISPECIES: hypothetical protein [unclassified Treponema]